ERGEGGGSAPDPPRHPRRPRLREPRGHPRGARLPQDRRGPTRGDRRTLRRAYRRVQGEGEPRERGRTLRSDRRRPGSTGHTEARGPPRPARCLDTRGRRGPARRQRGAAHERRAGPERRRPDRLRPRHRPDRDDSPGRGRGAGPQGSHAAAGLSPVRRQGGSGGGAGPRSLRRSPRHGSGREAGHNLHLRPFGDLGYRAEPGRGRPRAAHARSPDRRL
ncbi:MAG: Predicted L-lactate dehydrogenase, hypothetical protein subunit YkgG, partial [uncultured Rubrobacteraceae bacterium]